MVGGADVNVRGFSHMADIYYETVYFSGRVQGVGFRLAALEVAREFEVAGAVVNLEDGRVQLEAEGRAEEIGALVTALEARMHGYIRKTERAGGARRAAQFNGFKMA
jgi:acylphosphatase